MLWGTVYLERVIQTLQNSDAGVDPDLLQHLSPLGWEHINLTGNYNLAKPHQARPLTLPAGVVCSNREAPKSMAHVL